MALPPLAFRTRSEPLKGAAGEPADCTNVKAAACLAPKTLPAPFQYAAPAITVSNAWFALTRIAALPSNTNWLQFPPSVFALARLKLSSTAGVGFAGVATPVPVKVTGEPVTTTLSWMVSVPSVTAPTCVGRNTTLIVHELPCVNVKVAVVGQVPGDAARANHVLNAKLIPATLPVPVLFSVSVCAALVTPTATLPNANGPPATLMAGTDWATNSTAPMSNPPPCGLDLLKKSWFGAWVEEALLIAGEVDVIE